MPHMLKRLLTVAAVLCLHHGMATAQLQARDLNGDGAADAFYDALQDLTWLADAGRGAQGRWVDVNSWVDQLVAYGASDWRLPSVFLPTAPVSPSWCPLLFCTGQISLESELTRLHAQLGGQLNMFSNVQALYFTGTYAVPGMGQPFAQYVELPSGFSAGTDELEAPQALGYGWAVRDGDIADVSAIPEPATYALMLVGLAALGCVSRRGSGS